MPALNPQRIAESPEAEPWTQVVREMLGDLRFGTIQITVHDGRVVQIDRTERRRLDKDAGGIERR